MQITFDTAKKQILLCVFNTPILSAICQFFFPILLKKQVSVYACFFNAYFYIIAHSEGTFIYSKALNYDQLIRYKNVQEREHSITEAE